MCKAHVRPWSMVLSVHRFRLYITTFTAPLRNAITTTHVITSASRCYTYTSHVHYMTSGVWTELPNATNLVHETRLRVALIRASSYHITRPRALHKSHWSNHRHEPVIASEKKIEQKWDKTRVTKRDPLKVSIARRMPAIILLMEALTHGR